MAFLDDELLPARAAAVGAHVASCAECHTLLGDLRAVSTRLAAWATGPAPDRLVAPVGEIPRPTAPPAVTRLLTPRAMAIACAVVVLLAAASWNGWLSPTPTAESLTLFQLPTPPPQVPPSAPSDTQRFDDAWLTQPRVELFVAPEGAKVVVVVVVDWQCPACWDWRNLYRPILTKYEQTMPGAVKYVVKDWPWDSACNPAVTTTFGGHEASCEAAVAVRLARAHGQADAMMDWLGENQQILRDLKTVGAIDAIHAELRSLLGRDPSGQDAAAALAGVQADIAQLRALAVQSTPVFFINGVRATGVEGYNLPPEYFDRAIQLELKRAGGRR